MADPDPLGDGPAKGVPVATDHFHDEGHLGGVPPMCCTAVLPEGSALVLPLELGAVLLAPGEHVPGSLPDVGGDGVPGCYNYTILTCTCAVKALVPSS